jgi:hypothetical protein
MFWLSHSDNFRTLLVTAWQIQAASPYSPPKLILDEDDKS